MSIAGATGVREADLPWTDIGVRPGYNQRYQGFFDKQRRIGARLGSLYAEPYYHSPRHRHTFQQVRYVLSGRMKYGSEVYVPGDCLYLPEGAYYGPVKPVEGDGQLHFADIQFEGPSGIPYPTPMRSSKPSAVWPRAAPSRRGSIPSPAAASATPMRRFSRRSPAARSSTHRRG